MPSSPIAQKSARRSRRFYLGFAVVLALLIGALPSLFSADPPVTDTKDAATKPVEKGQRVLVAGHSFHVPMAQLLKVIAPAGGYADQQLVGVQFIGGSTVTQHWNLPDEKNVAKKHLTAGDADVLTLSPSFSVPDKAIDDFTGLLLKTNPDGRVLVQESWMLFDGQLPLKNMTDSATLKRNTRIVDELQRIQAPWSTAVETQVRDINTHYNRQVVFLVPVARAVIVLRGKIIEGKALGLKTQDDLFRDAMGHPGIHITLLSAYCHYAVIYRKSPVGIILPKAWQKHIDAPLNTLLQQLAWETVTQHPLSGVREAKKDK